MQCLQTFAHVFIDRPQNCAKTSFHSHAGLYPNFDRSLVKVCPARLGRSRYKPCPILCRLRTKLCPNFCRSRARLCPIFFAPYQISSFSFCKQVFVSINVHFAFRLYMEELVEYIEKTPQLYRSNSWKQADLQRSV